MTQKQFNGLPKYAQDKIRDLESEVRELKTTLSSDVIPDNFAKVPKGWGIVERSIGSNFQRKISKYSRIAFALPNDVISVRMGGDEIIVHSDYYQVYIIPRLQTHSRFEVVDEDLMKNFKGP